MHALTDDLAMEGAKRAGMLGQAAAVVAVKAGADLLLVSGLSRNRLPPTTPARRPWSPVKYRASG